MLQRLTPFIAFGLALSLSPSLASADEKNPAVEACQGKSEGDTCTAVRMVKGPEGQPEKRESPGTCQPDECCELDYSKGSPPETQCGPCLACKEGPPRPTPDGPTVSGGAAGDGGDGGGDAATPAADSGPPATTPNEKRGCTVGGAPAPWWSLLVVLAWVRRRY